ncbi:MAG: nitroreductase [Ruminococcaceae bacterium]|nr:nitroreductase [Oscillospiraceae bacterium]
MDFLKLCADRYSVRSFSSRPVEEELILKILEAGRLAPTAKNQQPQRIFVLKSEKALEKLHKHCKCYDAPVVLLVCGDTDVACNRPIVSHSMAEMDASIVATHMMLAAASLGVGSVWMCAFDNDAVAKEFDLPDNVKPYMLLPLGYPTEDCQPSPRHTQRFPIDETVKFL